VAEVSQAGTRAEKGRVHGTRQSFPAKDSGNNGIFVVGYVSIVGRPVGSPATLSAASSRFGDYLLLLWMLGAPNDLGVSLFGMVWALISYRQAGKA
jgi:hypothetical protein